MRLWFLLNSLKASVSPGLEVSRKDHLPGRDATHIAMWRPEKPSNLTTYELLLTIILWQFQSIEPPVFAGSLLPCNFMSPKNLEIRLDSEKPRINVTDVSRLLCCSEIRRKFWLWTNLWCKMMSLENGNYKLARGQRVRHTAGRLTDTQQVDVFPLALSLWSASDFETMILYTFVYERPSRATPKFLKTLKILRFASTPVRSFSRLSPASVCPDRRGRSLDNQPGLACGRISEISHTEKLKLIGLRTVWPAMGMPVFVGKPYLVWTFTLIAVSTVMVPVFYFSLLNFSLILLSRLSGSEIFRQAQIFKDFTFWNVRERIKCHNSRRVHRKPVCFQAKKTSSWILPSGKLT
jgi:hypothetical protein